MGVFICPQAPFLPCCVWEADLAGQHHLSSYALWLPVGYEQWRAMQMWEGIPQLAPCQVARDTDPSGQPSLQDSLFWVSLHSLVLMGGGGGDAG